MFCFNCGKKILDHANFCVYCGTNLRIADALAPQQEESPTPEQIPPSPYFQPPPQETIPPEPAPPPPPAPLHAIDSVRALRAIFKDPRWLQKMLLGGVIVAIPLIGFLAILPGYGLLVVGRVARGEENTLPEWNIGECLNKGISFFIYCFALFLGVLMILKVLRPVFSTLPLLDNLYGTFALAAMGALWVYTLAAFAFAGAENNPSAVFHFGRILDAMIDNPVPTLIALILNIASIFLAFSGVVGLYVCVIFTISLSAIFMSHIAGQFYRVAHTAGQT